MQITDITKLITGETFGKKFTLLSKDESKTIKFKFENSGIITDINFDANKNRDFISGILKSKILNSNLKFNFKYKDKKLNLFNSFFRSKNISFNYDSFIIFKPFFKTNSKFKNENINFKIFNELKIEDLLEKKKFLKKVNSKNYIKFKSKKYRSNLIDHLNLEFDLAYGRLIYFKKISINDHHFKCRGDTNLLEEFPLLFFDCNLISNNKHELLKKFSIKKKIKKERISFEASGNLSLLNNKINFNNISANNNYNATKEDLLYYKQIFENMLFNETFLKIFELKKIKKFILEIV